MGQQHIDIISVTVSAPGRHDPFFPHIVFFIISCMLLPQQLSGFWLSVF